MKSKSSKHLGVRHVDKTDSVDNSAWLYGLALVLIFLISSAAIIGPYGQKDGYRPDLHMSAYIQVGALVVLFLFLLSTFARKKIIILRSPLLLPTLLFYAWAMLSLLWAHAKYEAVMDALDWSGAFMCALLILLLLRDVKVIATLLFALLVSGLLIALLGIGQYLLGIDWVHQHIVPAATFANKNMAGQYGLLILPIPIALFFRSKNNLAILFFAIVSSLIMAYIFYTRSRGGWISFVVEVFVFAILLVYLKHKHNYHLFSDMPIKKIAFAISLVLFVGMAFMTPTMLGNTAQVMEASIGSKPKVLAAAHGGEVFDETIENITGSANQRITIWVNSLPMFLDHFLVGVGLGNWTVHYGRYQSWFKPDKKLRNNLQHINAHNDYVEILCELGIIGFMLFIWVIVALFKVMRRLLSHSDGKYFLLYAPLVVSLVGISLSAMFSFPLKQPISISLVMVYMALLSNLYGSLIEPERSYVLPFSFASVKVLATVAIFFAALGLFNLQRDWYKSELHYRKATVSLEKGRYKDAYTQAQRAYKLNSMHTILLWIEATALMNFNFKDSNKKIIKMLEEVLQVYPYSSNTILNLASAYNRSSQYENAVKVFAQLIKMQPFNLKVRYTNAMFLFNANKDEESLKEFNQEVLPLYRKKYEYYLGKVWRAEERLQGLGGVPLPLVDVFERRRKEFLNMEELVQQVRLKIHGKKINLAR